MNAPLFGAESPGAPPPFARELDLRGIEDALWPHFPEAPKNLALSISVALYREAALTPQEMIARAGIGRRRLPKVEAAMRLGSLLELKREVRSERDGSRRLVLSVNRIGNLVEAVTIPRRDDLVLCVSSQSGCALACAFCATGFLGLHGNLTPGEIVEQQAWAQRAAGRRVTDVTFMGMGEPLLNYDAVIAAANRLTAREGAQISPRRIVISTAGIAPRIRQYAREKHPFQLFFSLPSAIPEKRLRLMPIEARYPLPELIDAIREYQRSRRRNRLVTFEYVTIPGENMGAEDIEALGKLIEGIPSILNVIPYNATSARFRPPTWAEVKSFTTALRSLRIPIKVRYSGGKTIAAGCGQLAADCVTLPAGGGHMEAPPGIFSDLEGRGEAASQLP